MDEDKGNVTTEIKFERKDGTVERSISVSKYEDTNENSCWMFFINHKGKTQNGQPDNYTESAEMDMTQAQLRDFCKRTLQAMGE